MTHSSETLSRYRTYEGKAGSRAPRRTHVLVGAACVVAACALLFASEPPGAALKDDLTAVAGVVRALPASTARPRVDAAVKQSFRGRAVSVDSAEFPSVVNVTFHGIDRKSCLAAEASARRLEGAVVVELVGFPAKSDCGSRNDMTWRIMP